MFGTLRKQKQIIYLFITAAMILGMGFFGMGTAMKTAGPQGGAVAVVNGEPITVYELQERVDNQKRRVRAMLGDQADAFMGQLNLEGRALEEVIGERLALSEAKKLKIEVPDAELVEFIANLPYYQKDGKFDVDAYEKIPNRGTFEARLRDDMVNDKFRQYLSERVRLTPAEVRNSYLVRETKADLQYARINLTELGNKAKPSAEMVKAAASDKAALDSYYAEHKSEFTVPASAQFHQIRVGIPFQAAPAQKEAARKKIDEIAAKVKPDNFAEIAKANSDDEYAKKGGEVGWVDLKNTDPAMQKALEKLDPGQVSPVVETTFGFFLVKLDGKKPMQQKSFDEVKATVIEKVAARKASESYSEEKRKEWEKLLAEGKPLDAELKKLSIEIKNTGPFSLGQGDIPNVGRSDEMADALFTLTPEKPIYPKLVSYHGDYFYLKLKNLERTKDADWTKNADTFEKGLSTSIQQEVYRDWIEDAKKRAKIVNLVKAPAGSAPPAEME